MQKNKYNLFYHKMQIRTKIISNLWNASDVTYFPSKYIFLPSNLIGKRIYLEILIV